jgi:hypothetical protein
MAARLVARVVRPAVKRWRAFWDVDDRASNFMSEQELREMVARTEERRKAYEKEAAMTVAKRMILRRLQAIDAPETPSPKPATGGGGAESGSGGTGPAFDTTIAGMDARSFNVIWGSICALPVLVYYALCLWAEASVDEGDLASIRMANRMVLDRRLETIETLLAGDAGGAVGGAGVGAAAAARMAGSDAGVATASQIVAAAAAGAGHPGEEGHPPAAQGKHYTYSGDRAVYEAFMGGVEGELERRKAAMQRGQHLASTAPEVAAVAPKQAAGRIEPEAPPHITSGATGTDGAASPPTSPAAGLAQAVDAGQLASVLQSLERRLSDIEASLRRRGPPPPDAAAHAGASREAPPAHAALPSAAERAQPAAGSSGAGAGGVGGHGVQPYPATATIPRAPHGRTTPNPHALEANSVRTHAEGPPIQAEPRTAAAADNTLLEESAAAGPPAAPHPNSLSAPADIGLGGSAAVPHAGVELKPER